MERWKSPTVEQKRDLGARIWQDFLGERVCEVVTEEGIDTLLPLLLTEDPARAFWTQVPVDTVVSEAEGLRTSGLKLRDLLGPDAVAHLETHVTQGGRPNRKLIEQMMDQPYVRQALKNLVQRGIQQFLQGLRPNLGARKVPGGRVLGTIGRGLAHRAERAARAGKSLVEGVGGGLYKQLEEQLQPFLSGFMNRSVQTLSEVLFEGEEQARLAKEARLHVLRVLLDAPLSSLLPPPSPDQVRRQLTLAGHVAAHQVREEGHRERIERVVRAVYAQWADREIREVLMAFGLATDPPVELQEALGQLAYRVLARPSTLAFLEQELGAVW